MIKVNGAREVVSLQKHLRIQKIQRMLMMKDYQERRLWQKTWIKEVIVLLTLNERLVMLSWKYQIKMLEKLEVW